DEARVRGAATSGIVRAAAGERLNGIGKDIDVAAERGKERARGHAGDGEVDRAAPGVDASNAAADPVGQGVGRPEVVVADVEVEAAAGGNDVGHGIADVDGGQLKV